MTLVDPERTIRRLYGQEHGYFELPRREVRAVEATGGDELYGEITPAGLGHLLDHLSLGPDDVFYDLGSGIGKVVLQTALTHSLRGCTGIEAATSRHAIATRVLRRARRQGLIRGRRCRFLCGDFMEVDLARATVLYTCSTGFSASFMERLVDKLTQLRTGARLVTTQEIDDTPWFEPELALRLDMSWKRRSRLHVYRRTSVEPPEPGRRPRRRVGVVPT